jgi:hypothetical protein
MTCKVFHIDVGNDETLCELSSPIYFDAIQSDFDFSVLKKGDMIDTIGYRGQGLWYFDGKMLHKSIGPYGYFLPPEAFLMVLKYGISYFRNCGAEYVLAPPSLLLQYHGNLSQTEQYAISINELDE